MGAGDTWPRINPTTNKGVFQDGLNQQGELIPKQHDLSCSCRVLDPVLTP